MKTKEEIEKLAEKYYSQITLSQRTAFKLGYTQCQEDIRKDWQGYTISEKSDFIEFLNKQD